MSFHGPFHIGYVNQILNGTIPPENVVLPNYGANIYWLYHALLAAIVQIFNISAPTASISLNMFALVGSLYWINRILGNMDLKYKNPFIISCYAIFILCSLNLYGFLHYLYGYFQSNDDFPHDFFTSMYRSYTILMGDDRLSNLFRKFLNFNGFPIGVLYFFATLYYITSLLNKKINLTKILFLMLSIAGALIFHTTTGVFILITVPLSLIIVISYTNKGHLKKLILSIEPLELVIFVIACLFFLPVFHYIIQASEALPAKPTIETNSMFSLTSVFASTYPLWALMLVGLYFNKEKLSSSIRFLIIAILLGYTLSILVHVPDNNQYKYIFLSTIMLGTIVIVLLDRVACDSGKKNRFSALKVLLALALIVPFVNVIYVTVNGFISPWVGDNTYYFEGRSIYISDGEPFKKSYLWIKENTPYNTVVIAPYENKNDSRIYTVAERLPYVVYGHFFGEGIPEYHKRVKNVRQFYDPKISSEEKIGILDNFKKFSAERETILLVPKQTVDEKLFNSDKFELLYSSVDASIYKFKE
jgi:hypothetical protein